jgi:chromate transporter
VSGFAAWYATSRVGEVYLNESSQQSQVSLAEIGCVFLKLGTIAFGGPAAHIAMMEAEFVRKRQWITEAEFLDRLGAANRPTSTEVAIFVGHMKRGWRGLIVAGVCFIVPAAVLVTLIAIVYVRYGSLPQVEGALYGIKAVVIAIIAQALWKLARTAVKTKFLAAVGVSSVGLVWFGVDPIITLLIAGAICAACVAFTEKQPPTPKGKALVWTALSIASGVVAIPVSVGRLFLSFLKIGSVVFGSGYVLLAFLRTEFVTGLHWLTEKQLIDSVAVGQFTPGPLFTTATFIGYVVAGIPGAVVATIGIFLPGFLLVAATGPLIPKIRRSRTAGAALDGVIVASLALMTVVTYQLGSAALVDWFTVLIALISLTALLRFRISPVWLVVGAAVIGAFVKR